MAPHITTGREIMVGVYVLLTIVWVIVLTFALFLTILKPTPLGSKQMKLFQYAFLAVAAILSFDSIYWAVFVIAHFFAPEWEKTLGRSWLIVSVKGLTLLNAGVFGVLFWKTYHRLLDDIRAL